jgi:hypothetical protein
MEASDREMALVPLTEFLPDIVIKQLLDQFAKVVRVENLMPYISGLQGLRDQHDALLDVIVDLRATFRELKKANAATKKAEKVAPK